MANIESAFETFEKKTMPDGVPLEELSDVLQKLWSDQTWKEDYYLKENNPSMAQIYCHDAKVTATILDFLDELKQKRETIENIQKLVARYEEAENKERKTKCKDYLM